VVGYGRAEKAQVQQMIKLLLGLEQAPTPHDAADALAVALCHAHRLPGHVVDEPGARRAPLTSWRAYRPAGDPAPKRLAAARRGTTRP